MTKDTSTSTQPMSSFDSAEEVLGLVNEQIDKIGALKPIQIRSLNSFNNLHGYLIEFPLYTTFPSLDVVSERFISRRVGCWVYLTVRYKTVPVLIKSDGSGAGTIDLAYLSILLVPLSVKAFKSGGTQAVYDYAEIIVNEYIRQYKLIPGRHHHDLRMLNNTAGGMLGVIHKFEIRPTVKFVDAKALYLNSGLMHLSANTVDFMPDETQLMTNSMSGSEIWQQVQAPLYRLVQAYDANCYGDADAAITLASSSIEGFLMVSERIIRVYHYGEDKDVVERKIRKKSLSELLKYAETEYGLNIDKTTQKTAYGRWHHRCYIKRNNYIHKQDSHVPTESRSAIASSAKLISHIATLLGARYPRYSKIAYFTKLITKPLN
ncbi:MAG: hypothetical protein EON54_04260 [Alcaligenaceae bacterium]|nr:MAG: hypothetical protein EON54_04260 [Alcaligenaceae bacterium]